MDKMKESLIKLINPDKDDESKLNSYLKDNNIEDLFKNYRELELREDTKEQVESLIIILESYESK